MTFSEIIKGIVGLIIIGAIAPYFFSGYDPDKLLRNGDSALALGEYKKAAESFTEVCQDKESRYQRYACTNLARVADYYLQKAEVTGNYEEATGLYKITCKNGHGESCVILGNFYIFQKEYKQARKYHKYACNLGYQRSCDIYQKLLEKKEA